MLRDVIAAGEAYLMAMSRTTDPLPLDETRQGLAARRAWRALMDRPEVVRAVLTKLKDDPHA